MKRKQTGDPYKKIDWSDLRNWAGESVAARGREYQEVGSVRGLARTDDYRLVAWVNGTFEYATAVTVVRRRLISECTCPYGFACKHAVAVVLAYLRCLEDEEPIGIVKSNDSRFELLESGAEHDGEDDRDNDDDEFLDDDGYEDVAGRAAASKTRRKAKASADGALALLQKRSKKDLIEIITDLASHHPTVRQSLKDRTEIAKGKPAKLLEAIRRDLNHLSREGGWKDKWSGHGSIPDYAPVRERLNRLLSSGYADAVVEVATELLDAGTEQIEMSDDEGETAEEIASCLDVAFKALACSSLPPARRLLWAIEMELEDQFELCRGAHIFLAAKHGAKDWSVAADALVERLGKNPATRDRASSGHYQRDRLTHWIIVALEKSGRRDEVIPLCEREADVTCSYVRLVNRLIAAKRWKEALGWIERGIAATRKQLPGIASELLQALKKVREKDKDRLGVAAIVAEEFFDQPALEGFRKLMTAAMRAGVGPAVREYALHYLETGDKPQQGAQAAGMTAAWSLPDSRYLEDPVSRRSDHPMTGTLIDIAIAEDR
ncbi:MAG: SWIM zinc finger family protein, partial [Candidatus Binatia bacterium]